MSRRLLDRSNSAGRRCHLLVSAISTVRKKTMGSLTGLPAQVVPLEALTVKFEDGETRTCQYASGWTYAGQGRTVAERPERLGAVA